MNFHAKVTLEFLQLPKHITQARVKQSLNFFMAHFISESDKSKMISGHGSDGTSQSRTPTHTVFLDFIYSLVNKSMLFT